MAAPAGNATDVFVGRDAELDILRAELEQVRVPARRGLCLIDGPAGMGKTALVDRFLQAEDDLQVLRASGEPWEALVPYGIVDQLTRGAGVSRARILAGRERALSARRTDQRGRGPARSARTSSTASGPSSW